MAWDFEYVVFIRVSYNNNNKLETIFESINLPFGAYGFLFNAPPKALGLVCNTRARLP
jgi:hypothetical protein